MSDDVKASVIMTTLNCADYIEEAVESVVRQSSSDWELLLMDAVSTDGTVEKVEAFDDPRIRVYSEPDEGQADAWDKGLQLARGDYVTLLCGNDVYSDLDWLRTCTQVMDEDVEVSIVWGVPAVYDGRKLAGTHQWPWGMYSGAPDAIEQVQKRLWLYNWLSTGAYFCDGNMSVRRNVLLRCMPRWRSGTSAIASLFAFYYNFNAQGFLPYGVPRIVSLSRLHDDSWTPLNQGQWALTIADYMRRVRRYRRDLLSDRVQQVFRDGDCNEIGVVPPLSGRVQASDFNVSDPATGEFVDGTRLYEKHILGVLARARAVSEAT